MRLINKNIVIAAMALIVWGAVSAAPEKNLLFAHDWSLLIINNQALRMDKYPDKKPSITLKEDGTFQAFTGCNQVSGKFKYTPEKGLQFGHEFSVTKMACDKYFMNIEDEFIRSLSKVNSYNIQEDKVLYFLDADNKSVAIFTNVMLY